MYLKKGTNALNTSATPKSLKNHKRQLKLSSLVKKHPHNILAKLRTFEEVIIIKSTPS